MKKQTKHPDLANLESMSAYRFREDAANYLTDFFNDEYSLGHKENFPCPKCFKRDSIRCYRSKTNGEVRGFKCDSCGFEKTMKDDLHDAINSILYYTRADDAVSVEISKHLYHLFTERMDYVLKKEKNPSLQLENDIII